MFFCPTKMNPAMINSTNSVSTSKRKREAERSVNWTVEETQVLLCAWSDERVQKSLAENLRNRHVFKHFSARMAELGFSRSPHQCRLRVKTLKANYVRAKLQRSMDSSQPCTFKYFAEMDAVLGRRGAVEAGGGPLCLGPMGGVGRHLGSMDRTAHSRTSGSSEAEVALLHLGPPERTPSLQSAPALDRRVGPVWALGPEVKTEDRECSTDEFEFVSQPLRVRHQGVLQEPDLRQEPVGPADDSMTTPSPPPPSPPPPAPANPGPAPQPAPGPPRPPAEPLEPVLQHLLQCFQGLLAETRGLLQQLEAQRQEQGRWHQELLSRWLEREERRQREAADREERREKARMEHEIRVLELLASLAQPRGTGDSTLAPHHKIEDGSGNGSDA